MTANVISWIFTLQRHLDFVYTVLFFCFSRTSYLECYIPPSSNRCVYIVIMEHLNHPQWLVDSFAQQFFFSPLILGAILCTVDDVKIPVSTVYKNVFRIILKWRKAGIWSQLVIPSGHEQAYMRHMLLLMWCHTMSQAGCILACHTMWYVPQLICQIPALCEWKYCISNRADISFKCYLYSTFNDELKLVIKKNCWTENVYGLLNDLIYYFRKWWILYAL